MDYHVCKISSVRYLQYISVVCNLLYLHYIWTTFHSIKLYCANFFFNIWVLAWENICLQESWPVPDGRDISLSCALDYHIRLKYIYYRIFDLDRFAP